MQKAGDGAPRIFFSPAQGRSFARRDFFPSPVTFLAAKENGTCSGSSQNSREQAVSNPRLPHPGEVFPYIPALPRPHGQGAVRLLGDLPGPVAPGGGLGQTAPYHDTGAAGDQQEWGELSQEKGLVLRAEH